MGAITCPPVPERGFKMADSQAKTAWDAAHTTQIRLKLNNNTDADILEKLASVTSKQGYIKYLIRADLASK